MTNEERLREQIDQFWQIVEMGFDIEPRAYFEREAPRNGFGSPLAQAAHHMWKRDPKVADLQAKLTAAEARLAHLEAELARWKVCSLCGGTMAEPGACSSAERERKEGYESMYEKTMDRAEAAEAKLTSLEASHHALTEKLTALVEQWRKHAKWEHNRGNDESSGESQAYAYGNEHAHDRCAEDLLAALSPVAPEGPTP